MVALVGVDAVGLMADVALENCRVGLLAMMLEVGTGIGLPVGVGEAAAEAETEMVMPTVLQRLSVNAMVSSLQLERCCDCDEMRLTLQV